MARPIHDVVTLGASCRSGAATRNALEVCSAQGEWPSLSTSHDVTSRQQHRRNTDKHPMRAPSALRADRVPRAADASEGGAAQGEQHRRNTDRHPMRAPSALRADRVPRAADESEGGTAQGEWPRQNMTSKRHLCRRQCDDDWHVTCRRRFRCPTRRRAAALCTQGKFPSTWRPRALRRAPPTCNISITSNSCFRHSCERSRFCFLLFSTHVPPWEAVGQRRQSKQYALACTNTFRHDGDGKRKCAIMPQRLQDVKT